MKQILRYSFVALLAMVCGNVFAQGITIDFDNDYATLFPNLKGTSSGSGDNYVADGDFTETTTSTAVSGFTVTVSVADEGKNANRIWGSAPRLRMYSGTFTVKGTGIKQIEFTSTANKFNLSASTGTLSEKVWKGDANEVVFTVGGNTQLNKIVINGDEQEPETYTLVGAGTLENPFTAKDAIYLANKGEYASEKIYITGKVFKVNTKDENITKYGNIDYFISEDGQEANPSFEIYRGKYFDDAPFTVDNKVKVGDEVVVYGTLKMYGSQAETDAGAILIKLNGGTTNINAVKADQQNGAVYNVAGQLVTPSYKGLVIKNGKKFVNK